MKRFLCAKYAPHALAVLALLTLVTTVVRSLALALAFDADIGYFRSGDPLVILLYALTLLGVAFCGVLFLFINKGKLQPPASSTTLSLVAAGVCALLCAITAVYLLIRGNTLPAPALISILALLALLGGAAYFATALLHASPAVRVLLGYTLLLALMLVMALTYFDRYTQMNAPHKVSQHLSILAALLALLAELRVMLGKAPCKKMLPWAALAGFACATVGLSNTVAFALGAYTDITYLLFDLLLLSLSLHFAAVCAGMRPTCADKEVEQ